MASEALQANPRNPDVDRLVGHLFRGSSDNPHQTNMKEAEDSFVGIVRGAGTEFTGTSPFSATEVIFYCNLDRVVKRLDGRWLDLDTSSVFETRDEHDVCKQKKYALAWTWIPGPHTARDGSAIIETYFPSQITLCPWFIEWATKQPIKSIKDFAKLSTWARLGVPMVSRFIFSEIDKVGLLEKVLLHELTHTAAGGNSEDVYIGDDAPFGFHGAAYGWKSCKKLADQNRANKYVSGLKNADSLALFASGVQLLDSNPPVYIKDDGSLTRNQPRKRSINGTDLAGIE